jgi:hypothetical protein
MPKGPVTVTFNQPGLQAQHATFIGTLEGGYVVNNGSTLEDLKKINMKEVIAQVRSDIQAFSELPSLTRTQLDKALSEAISVTPSPAAEPVRTRLQTGVTTLKGLEGTMGEVSGFAQKALNLAETLSKIGDWVVSAL